MADINIIMDEIEVLRERLSSLIESRGELLDPEVLMASVLLDNALNDYNKFEFTDSGAINNRSHMLNSL